MVESLTQNYHWTKPEVTKSASTWGGFLNTDLDSIDALVFANQQGIAPIGSGALWFTNTPPANWLIANGASLSTTTYAALFAVYGYAFGGSGANFNLPNLINRFPMGAGTLAATGGEANHTLSSAEMPVHAHGVSDPTHGHTIADPAHTHGVSDPTHVHGASQDAHNHTVANAGLAAGVNLAGGSTFNMINTSTTSTAQPPVHISAASTGIGIQASGTGIGIQASGTGITLQNNGGGAAHNNLPPYLQINFIVRYA